MRCERMKGRQGEITGSTVSDDTVIYPSAGWAAASAFRVSSPVDDYYTVQYNTEQNATSNSTICDRRQAHYCQSIGAYIATYGYRG